MNNEEKLQFARGFDPEFLYVLRDLADDLFVCEGVELATFEIYASASEVEVNIAEDASGIAAPEHVLSFYTLVSNGFELRWNIVDGDKEVPGGTINVVNFARVFGNWLDEVWGVTPEGADPAVLDFSWELRCFDLAASNSNYIAALHVAELEPTYDLYFHDPQGGSHKLNVTFAEYFDCLQETMGFHGWQFLVSDVDFNEVPEALERAEAFHEVMPKLFPDLDLSRYRTP